VREIDNQSRAGVTLLEVLIAVTLVSLLSAGMLMAIRGGIQTLELTNSRIAANRRVLGAQRAIDQQLSGLIPVPATCGGGPPGQPAGPTGLVFLQGDPESLRLVTSHSLEEAGRGYPRILEYAIIPGREQEGVRLIANEYLYTGPDSLAFFCLGVEQVGQRLRLRPVEPNPRSFVLADRLARCSLSYQVRDPKTGQPVWLPIYSGIQPPLAIRIQMVPLDEDRARLRMGTITVPIRVTRDLKRVYKDIDDPEQP
jgi:prepilin-type N-terminal cleavage/methylation domain-containing protein